MAIGQTGNSNTYDGVTNAIQAIDYAHHEIHGGSSYQANISTADVQGNPLRIKFVTADTTKEVHVLAFGVSSGTSTFTITEAPTGGAAGGSSLAAIQKNRNSSNTSESTLTSGVTEPTGGTVLTIERHGFDKDKISGETRSSGEWVLKTNTTYVFELESGTGDVVGNLLLEWYEHTPKN